MCMHHRSSVLTHSLHSTHRRATQSCAASASTRRARSRCRTVGTRCARRARWRCAATASPTRRRLHCHRRPAPSAAAASRGCSWPGQAPRPLMTRTRLLLRRPPPRSLSGGGPGDLTTSVTAGAAASRGCRLPWPGPSPRSGAGRAGWPTVTAAAAWTSPSTTCDRHWILCKWSRAPADRPAGWLVVVKLKQPLPLAFQDEDIQASVIVGLYRYILGATTTTKISSVMPSLLLPMSMSVCLSVLFLGMPLPGFTWPLPYSIVTGYRFHSFLFMQLCYG